MLTLYQAIKRRAIQESPVDHKLQHTQYLGRPVHHTSLQLANHGSVAEQWRLWCDLSFSRQLDIYPWHICTWFHLRHSCNWLIAQTHILTLTTGGTMPQPPSPVPVCHGVEHARGTECGCKGGKQTRSANTHLAAQHFATQAGGTYTWCSTNKPHHAPCTKPPDACNMMTAGHIKHQRLSCMHYHAQYIAKDAISRV